MKVLVVGAGLTGAAVARKLSPAFAVTVMDKARGVGGRTSVHRRSDGGSVVDMGAQYVTRSEHADSSLYDRLTSAGVLVPVDPAVIVGSPDRAHGDKRHYCAPAGMNSVAKTLLPDSVDLVLGSRVTALEVGADGTLAAVGEDGTNLAGGFSAAVLTTPVPQIMDLLAAREWSKAVVDAHPLGDVLYSSRYAVAMHFPDTPAVTAAVASIGATAAYLKPAADGALRYVSVETAKHGASGPASLLLHSAATYAPESKDVVVPRMLEELRAQFPAFVAAGDPVEHHRVWWRYSQVRRSPFSAGAVVVGNVVLAGDAFAGSSGFDACMRSAAAAAAGVEAAVRGGK